MNQTILQPPYTYVHYGQAYRIRHSIKSSYKTPLHHHHFIIFLKPTTHSQPSNLVDPVPLVQ